MEEEVKTKMSTTDVYDHVQYENDLIKKDLEKQIHISEEK